MELPAITLANSDYHMTAIPRDHQPKRSPLCCIAVLSRISLSLLTGFVPRAQVETSCGVDAYI